MNQPDFTKIIESLELEHLSGEYGCPTCGMSKRSLLKVLSEAWNLALEEVEKVAKITRKDSIYIESLNSLKIHE